MSGTGKSTLAAALVERGIRAIDLDDGYCEVARDGEWIWNEPLVRELLQTAGDDTLVIAGCASNQGAFYGEIDLVVVLSAPASVMIERIRTRTGNHFGQSAEEMDRVMSDLASIEPRLRRSAHREIRTDRPLHEVLGDVLALLAP